NENFCGFSHNWPAHTKFGTQLWLNRKLLPFFIMTFNNSPTQALNGLRIQIFWLKLSYLHKYDDLLSKVDGLYHMMIQTKTNMAYPKVRRTQQRFLLHEQTQNQFEIGPLVWHQRQKWIYVPKLDEKPGLPRPPVCRQAGHRYLQHLVRINAV